MDNGKHDLMDVRKKSKSVQMEMGHILMGMKIRPIRILCHAVTACLHTVKIDVSALFTENRLLEYWIVQCPILLHHCSKQHRK